MASMWNEVVASCLANVSMAAVPNRLPSLAVDGARASTDR